jgi:hypothetical protein
MSGSHVERYRHVADNGQLLVVGILVLIGSGFLGSISNLPGSILGTASAVSFFAEQFLRAAFALIRYPCPETKIPFWAPFIRMGIPDSKNEISG